MRRLALGVVASLALAITEDTATARLLWLGRGRPHKQPERFIVAAGNRTAA